MSVARLSTVAAAVAPSLKDCMDPKRPETCESGTGGSGEKLRFGRPAGSCGG